MIGPYTQCQGPCIYTGTGTLGPSKTGILIGLCETCLASWDEASVEEWIADEKATCSKCFAILHTRASVETGLCLGCRSARPQQILPAPPIDRKAMPVCTGVLDYFPDALRAVSRLSKIGNDKHNPGQPLHWAKEKSKDHADALARHLMERGTVDPESGMSHSVGVAWRALALLQIELEGGK